MISMNCWSPQSDQRGVVLGNGNNTSHGNGNSHISPPVAVLKRAAAAAKYRECQKNHAAAIGGNATDGCGEFMPGGERGTIEALKCSACGCHRNFHRKDQADAKYDCHGAALGHHYASETTEERATNAVAVAAGSARKRFRTKFTAEQKEKMWRFAEKAGWKIQKVEESEVERLCREIGIKRRVLKVWMHNNKHHFANKLQTSVRH